MIVFQHTAITSAVSTRFLGGADLLAFLIEVDAGVAGLGSGAARASER